MLLWTHRLELTYPKGINTLQSQLRVVAFEMCPNRIRNHIKSSESQVMARSDCISVYSQISLYICIQSDLSITSDSLAPSTTAFLSSRASSPRSSSTWLSGTYQKNIDNFCERNSKSTCGKPSTLWILPNAAFKSPNVDLVHMQYGKEIFPNLTFSRSTSQILKPPQLQPFWALDHRVLSPRALELISLRIVILRYWVFQAVWSFEDSLNFTRVR